MNGQEITSRSGAVIKRDDLNRIVFDQAYNKNAVAGCETCCLKNNKWDDGNFYFIG